MKSLSLNAHSRVCAVVVARIGDTLLVTPALRALRAASGQLTVLAHPQRQEVLRHLDFIDRLGAISKHSAWLRGWLPPRFDAVFCWGREPALLRYCLRAARRCVAFDHPEFAAIRSDRLLRVAVPPESSLHAVRERLLPVTAAGVIAQDLRLAYSVTAAERQFAQAWLSAQTPSKPALLVGLQPFSFPTKAHRDWPLSHFTALIRRLGERYAGAHILVLGDTGARERALPLHKALPGRVTIAAGRLDLRQSAALMQELDLYLGVDTGPTHIAGALGIPMIALYNRRYPGRNLMPLDHQRCIAIEASTEDMSALTVDEVWTAVCQQLDAKGARA